MSEPRWTPGEWLVDPHRYTPQHGPPYLEVFSNRDACWIAKVQIHLNCIATEAGNTNAQLIASVKDLYAAAELACLMFDRKNHSTADSDWMGDDEHEAWTALRKAAAKARGESPGSDIEARRRQA